MLPSTAHNITCDTDIKGAITLAGEDVDARTLLAHAAIDRPLFMPGAGSGSPLSRGRRKFVVPSERGYRSEMGTTYANLRNQVLGSGQWRGTVPKLPTSQGRSRSPQPSSHPPLRRAPRRERQPFCSHRAHSVPDRAAAIRRYKLGLAPSDIRFYLRFDARCWPIGPEKREVEGDAFVKRPARGLENAPFDLVADAVGIDRLAAIHSGSGTHQADAAALWSRSTSMATAA